MATKIQYLNKIRGKTYKNQNTIHKTKSSQVNKKTKNYKLITDNKSYF